jgi:hypothetical protein
MADSPLPSSSSPDNWAKRREPSPAPNPQTPPISAAAFPASGRKALSRTRLGLALTIAIISDGLSIWLELFPPAQWTLDILTAVALFALLGARWEILPALIAEAIPGVAAFPFWVLVVGSVYVAQRGHPTTRDTSATPPTQSS